MMRVISLLLCILLTACAGGGGGRGKPNDAPMLGSGGLDISRTMLNVAIDDRKDHKPLPTPGSLPAILIVGIGAYAAIRLRERQQRRKRRGD